MSQVLPPELIESLTQVSGFDEEGFIEVHQNRQPVTSIRLNPAKPTPAIGYLQIEESVPWCPEGKYLSERPSFTLDPIFHGGAYYVQEASSMFIDYIIKQIYSNKAAPNKVLDLCAAPGGKSTLLAAALPDSLIVSNEVIKTRVGVLAENLSKWGSNNVVVTNSDPQDFKRLPSYFDLMIVDAPCSGSGLFRKDADAIEEWSEANVQMCSLRQQRILTDAIGSLKSNGFLIYSTCSYSQQENEDICDWIVDNFSLQPVEIQIDAAWGIVPTVSGKHHAHGYRFYPNKLKGEGFFLACFKQSNIVDEYYGDYRKRQPVSKQVSSFVEPFLAEAGKYQLSDQKKIVIASLKKWEEEMSQLAKELNVRKSGVAVGIVKGRDFIPHHELALSHLLSIEIPTVNLTKEDALKYLKRQDLTVETSKKGWTLCTYEQINLGWIKVLPNRVNNYYPTNWRILKP